MMGLTCFDVIELIGELKSLKSRIAELESEVAELKPYRDGYDPEEEKTVEVMNWNAIVAENKECEE